MKTFLASISRHNNQFSMLKHSNSVQTLNTQKLFILFTGHRNTLSEIRNAYEREGMHLLKRLNDGFSLLLYDKQKKQLFIAKDKVGIEPLYFTESEEHIIISTHLKEFHKVPSFDAQIHPSSVGEYLQFGFILQPNTIFKDCHKVCSGEYVCFDLNQNTSKITNYWQLESCYAHKKTKQAEKEILEETSTLLHEVVEANCQTSAFGVSLSGGYDSSTLAAICQAQSTQKIDTFTIGFHDKEINEAPHAKAISKHLGTRHHEHYFSEKDAERLIPKMCQIYDEPFADHATTPTILTSQLLKEKHLSNLIAGDGGDEVFATAEDVHTFKRLQETAIPVKKLLAKSLNCIKLKKFPYLKDYNNLPKKQNKLLQLLEARSIPQMIHSRNTLFLDEELETHIINYSKPIKTSFDNIHFYGHAEAVDEVIGSYFKTTMVDGELVKSYASMNYLDISLSTPFLDTRLIEQMAQVPSSIKIKNGTKKYLLKKIAHQYIPKALIDRPKSGFDIPFSSWMRGNLKDLLYSQINKTRLDKDSIFYTTSILNIRDQFYAGNDAYKYKLWRIFIFQLWYENFTHSQHKKG